MLIDILLSILFQMTLNIKGYIQLNSGNYFPINTAPIIDNQWDHTYWDNYQIAWLDKTGWVDDKYGIILASHTYGPLYEALYYEQGDKVYILFNQYTYTYSYDYWEYITDIPDMQRIITSQKEELIFIVCDPVQENRIIAMHFNYISAVYTGDYQYN